MTTSMGTSLKKYRVSGIYIFLKLAYTSVLTQALTKLGYAKMAGLA
jgi:hypothetical protein